MQDILRHYDHPQRRTDEVIDEEHDEDDEEYNNHLLGYYAHQPVVPSKLGYGDSGGSYHASGEADGYHYSSPGASAGGGGVHPGYSYVAAGGHGDYSGGYGDSGVSSYSGGKDITGSRSEGKIILLYFSIYKPSRSSKNSLNDKYCFIVYYWK